MLSIQKPNFVSFRRNDSNKTNDKTNSHNSESPKNEDDYENYNNDDCYIVTQEEEDAQIKELKEQMRQRKEIHTKKIKNRINNAFITIMVAGGIVSIPTVLGVFNDKNKTENKKDPTEIVVKKSLSGDSVIIAQKRSQDSIDAKNEEKKKLEKETTKKETHTNTTRTKGKSQNLDLDQLLYDFVSDEIDGAEAAKNDTSTNDDE